MNVFELKILDFIQENLKCGFLDWFMPLVTKLGDAGIFWIIVAVVLLFTKKYRKVGAMMGVALVMGLLVVNCGIKPLVDRIRPYDMPGVNVDLLVDRLHDGSFPSGHTVASFEASVVLMLNDKRLGIPALIIAVLVSLSRLYLYVHYPSDVLVSVVLGIVFAFLAVKIVNKTVDTFQKRKLEKQ